MSATKIMITLCGKLLGFVMLQQLEICVYLALCCTVLVLEECREIRS